MLMTDRRGVVARGRVKGHFGTNHWHQGSFARGRAGGGMGLGAGLLVALAAGAAAGGWWLLGGVVLAGILSVCSAWEAPTPEWMVSGARSAATLAGVPLFASVFAAYLVPEHRALAAMAFVLVITAADAAGPALPR